MTYDFECGTCYKTFPAGWKARDNHLRSTGHRAPAFECDTCARYFGSEKARFQHMVDVNHFLYECTKCYETWPTEEQQIEHEHKQHHYCGECNRTFNNYNNIKMHLNSNVHRGQNIQCPLCKNNFATATGLTHHLETGSCPRAANINRDTLYKFVRSKDPGGVMTKNLIDWPGSTQYEANDRSYNWARSGWECYLCHRLFNNLRGLNQHLNSPTHQEKLYHCPKPACIKEFTTLAAIINHLESEACGFTRFENVQQNIKNVISGNRMIGF
ncbi:hypothetical protein F4809DRAFT_177822 [Biscogniauxia mediterranea]|nr:hypothetical protein F4809DRAFT_177822 [Biscogniauxia mediterranea]